MCGPDFSLEGLELWVVQFCLCEFVLREGMTWAEVMNAEVGRLTTKTQNK